MLPGKKYTPEEYLRVVWDRRWVVIVPTVVVATAVAIYAYLQPDRYRSTAVVLVVGQQVPENMVQSTITDTVEERLRAIQQQILSRTRLEGIIDEFDLYRRERETMIMEDIVEQMRTRDLAIGISTSRGRRSDATSFNVSFTADQPRTAMRVADRLASLFVQENLLNRGNQAENTSLFMQATLDESKRKLQEQDQRLAEFRRQHSGRLPTQSASNLQVLQSVTAQIQANADADVKDRDRLALLEMTLAELSAKSPGTATGPGAPAAVPAAAAALAAARASLDGLKLKYKDDHPDVKGALRVVAELEAKVEEQALAMPLSPDARVAVVAAPRAASPIDTRAAELRLQIQELSASIGRRKQEDVRLRAQLASYQARLEATPNVEAELADLTRDYDTTRESYEKLLRQNETARISESLERRQIGETFKTIDSARLPERPVSPDRMRLNLLGLAAGLGLGLGLVALLEYRDTTLKTDTDVLISLSLPVLAVIPAMTNARERRLLKQRRRLMAAAASVMAMLAGAAAIEWRFRVIQDWIR